VHTVAAARLQFVFIGLNISILVTKTNAVSECGTHKQKCLVVFERITRKIQNAKNVKNGNSTSGKVGATYLNLMSTSEIIRKLTAQLDEAATGRSAGD